MLDRKPSSHKGENGKILVVGGSKKYSGAPFLAGMAALRAGADLVTVATSEKTARTINSLSPDLITLKLDGEKLEKKHVKQIEPEIRKYDCLLLGPGLDNAKGTQEAVKELCNESLPKVVDADALVKGINREESVVTPHAREFREFFGKKPVEKNVKELASEEQIILLKGPTDFISNGKEVFRNEEGNAGMTVGGTGDVLSGLTASLVAQGKNLFDSACLAAEINSEAGNKLFREFGYGYIASDLVSVVPEAFMDVVSNEAEAWQYFR